MASQKTHCGTDVADNSETSGHPPNSVAAAGPMPGARQSGSAAQMWSMTPELQEIAESDPAMMSELLALFLFDSLVRLQSLSDASGLGDFKTLRAQAHSLKGSSLQLGATSLASLCASLELSDRPGPEQRGAMVGAIGDECILVQRAMEEYLAGGRSVAAVPLENGRQIMVTG